MGEHKDEIIVAGIASAEAVGLPTVKEKERVKAWNTYLKIARDHAISLKKLQQPSWEAKGLSLLGGTLAEDGMYRLALVIWCYLALEARVNHLITELNEKHVLSDEESKAILNLRTEQKWALLPKLAGRNVTIDFSRSPHQCVTELCSLRNGLLHVNYDTIEKLQQTPPNKALSLFDNFVDAVEDMNVILGRHQVKDPDVLKIALH